MRLLTTSFKSVFFHWRKGWSFAIVSIVVLSVLYFKTSQGVNEYWSEVSFRQLELKYVWLVFLLLPFNYLLEAWKWSKLTSKIDSQSLLESLITVLIGKSLNMITPFAIGDVYARFQRMNQQSAKYSIGALAINRATQMVPTLLAGAVAVVYLLNYTTGYDFLIGLIVAFFLIGLTFFLIIKKLRWRWSEEYISAIKNTGFSETMILLGMSCVRYAVFTLQFVLTFWIFQVEIEFIPLLFGVFWIFLIKTILPNITIFGDLVKREVSAVAYFSFFPVNIQTIAVVSFVIWFVNIVIPALTGLLFVSKLSEPND